MSKALSRSLKLTLLGLGLFSACSDGTTEPTHTGGSKVSPQGGSAVTGGVTATGGITPVSTGGNSTGGLIATGGLVATGGRATGGAPVATGGSLPDTGGVAPNTGGMAPNTGGMTPATGGVKPPTDAGTPPATGGIKPPTDAATATGGTTPVGGATTVDCTAAMPTSGGTSHCGSYQKTKAGSLEYELWSNSYSGSACITTYSVPAFSAKWSNNSDFLARLGVSWGGKSIATLGTITADFSVKKSGTAGGYSYIGVYGWAKSPCTEYYIIDDSQNSMPFNPWNMTQKGSATIDGEVYKFYSGSSGGTGGSQCGTPFTQNWSVRQKGRSCGTITISKHFEEWGKNGMTVDGLLEAKVLVEAGGGTGSVEFPVANVKASN